MLTPDDIIASFAAAAVAFDPVIGAPTDYDVKRIHCNVVNFLQSFCFHGSQDILSGLINPEARYLVRFSNAFNRFDTADADNYDPHIPSNTEIGERSQREAIFEAKKSQSLLVYTANRSARLFILFVVEETWVHKI